MSAVERIVAGNGYYDRAEVLWALLMVCDRCGSRTIDCPCGSPDSWSADDRLTAAGREMEALAIRPVHRPVANPLTNDGDICAACSTGDGVTALWPCLPASAVPERTDLDVADEAALREALAFWDKSGYTYGSEDSFYRTSHNRAESHYCATVTPTRLARLLATLDRDRAARGLREALIRVEDIATDASLSENAAFAAIRETVRAALSHPESDTPTEGGEA